jgi:hypothetical protein
MKIKSTTAFRSYANARAKARHRAGRRHRALHGEVGEQGRLDQPNGAHQERLEVRRVCHRRGRGEAAGPARGDEPRLALRGGLALTRATGADVGPTSPRRAAMRACLACVPRAHRRDARRRRAGGWRSSRGSRGEPRAAVSQSPQASCSTPTSNGSRGTASRTWDVCIDALMQVGDRRIANSMVTSARMTVADVEQLDAGWRFASGAKLDRAPIRRG